MDVSAGTQAMSPPEQTATNQKVINAFVSAAKALGDEDEAWKWFSSAKLNSILDEKAAMISIAAKLSSTCPNSHRKSKRKFCFPEFWIKHTLSWLGQEQPYRVLHCAEQISTSAIPYLVRKISNRLNCCRLVYKMSMETGNTDFDKAEQVYHNKLSSYIASK